MRFLSLSCFAVIVFAFAGCAFAPPLEDISEVSLTGQTGLLGTSFTVAFRRDGTARCECNFYRLDENHKPKIDNPEPLCGALYRDDPAAFVETRKTNSDVYLKAEFTGNISKEAFGEIAQLANKNGFFSMNEKNIELAMDAPPDFTRVIYASGKTKEVSDNLGKGGEKLSEIKRAIYGAAKETKWESGQK